MPDDNASQAAKVPGHEHRPTVEEKFWEIEVDYPNDQTYPTKGNSTRIYSYLRLGTANPFDRTATARGDDLASLVTEFVDDTRNRGTGAQAPLTAAERQSESALLHHKGGWRDHSDGNRVSTTRGDSVEVIRGNYRRLVLGRQSDACDGALFDASGGLIQDGDIAPGSVTEIRWVQDTYGGTWRVIEEATKGDTVTRYHGDVDEIFYGNKITTTVGSETPTAAIPAGSAVPRTAKDAAETLGREAWVDEGTTEATVKRANPTIVERTWAEKVESYTGSSKLRVPSIAEEIWAAKKSELVDCSGEVTSETRAGSSTETVTIQGWLKSKNTADVVDEVVDAKSVARSATYAPQVAEFSASANRTSLTISAFHEELTIGVFAEIFLGAKLSMIAGGEVDITLGAKKEINGLGELKTSLTELRTTLNGAWTSLQLKLGIGI
ncbi:MAG: hypothetical protein HY908_21715 [Myxococcales bacterium]|nr:hypothetical protein [Myxococcales bacterium]